MILSVEPRYFIYKRLTYEWFISILPDMRIRIHLDDELLKATKALASEGKLAGSGDGGTVGRLGAVQFINEIIRHDPISFLLHPRVYEIQQGRVRNAITLFSPPAAPRRQLALDRWRRGLPNSPERSGPRYPWASALPEPKTLPHAGGAGSVAGVQQRGWWHWRT